MAYDIEQIGAHRVARYFPTAFYLKFYDPLFNEDGTVRCRMRPVFMHEYTHLVQDRATFFGALDFVQFYNRFQCLSQSMAKRSGRVVVPLSKQVSDHTFHEMADLRLIKQIEKLEEVTHHHTSWSSNAWWPDDCYERKEVMAEYAGGVVGIPVRTVCFVESTSGDVLRSNLTGLEICEGYAAAVGQLHGETQPLSSLKVKYTCVWRILESAFGDQVDARSVVAFCHWSLSDRAPGAVFFDLLEEVRRHSGESIPGADEVYDICREHALRYGIEQRIGQMIECVDGIAANQRQAGVNDGFYHVLNWYASEATRLLLLSLDSSRRFPLDTYLAPGVRPSVGTQRSELESFHREVPIPQIEDHDGTLKTCSVDELEEQAAMFVRCLADLVWRLWSSQSPEWSCPFEGICPLATVRDDECRRAPWRKARLRPPCPYSAAAHYLNLADKEICVEST